jgi:hypothetical protein
MHFHVGHTFQQLLYQSGSNKNILEEMAGTQLDHVFGPHLTEAAAARQWK